MIRRSRIASFAAAAAFVLVSAIASADGPAASTMPESAATAVKARFDLPAEPLGKALRDFAIQANCNISYEPAAVAGLAAPAIKGEFNRANALSLMLAGTRLVAVNVNEDTIQVVPKTGSSSRTPAAADVLRVAYAGADPPAEPIMDGPPSEAAESSGKSREDRELQEITVTGTHIRGTKDSPSPVEIYTRADIDATGANTVQQFLQTLPQNFNGGASENTISTVTGSGQSGNSVNGSAPNLRGLGSDATLVLINGHRVAPGNDDGGFVDVSLIPLTAIERVEIVTDGASAIYGSDAVGGVVNFILRKQYDGAESRLQFGAVGTGSRHDLQVGQTAGEDWGNGSALLTYQYSDQTPLSAASRSYLPDVPLPFDLLPEQVEHAVFANLEQEITSGVSVHTDLIYSHRSTDLVYTIGDPIDGYETGVMPSRIDGYSASIGSSIRLPHQSRLEISTTYSESDTLQQLLQSPSNPALQFIQETKSAIISVDANVDGVLAATPPGALRYAVGGQYRKESFGNTYVYPATDNTFFPDRQVGAAYVELRIPVMQARGSPGNPVLEMTLADRAEHYSDFGSTNNPQIGGIWKPVQSTKIRGTYGTSFKAPLLSQLNPVPSQVVPIPGYFFNPAPGGTPNTLNVYGGNPNLKPEKATVWTVGLDLTPASLRGFTARFTYYDISFKDQIAEASASYCSCNAFVDAAILGPAIVQRNPSAALIQQLIAEPTFENFYDVDPSTIGAIFDSRYFNLSTVKTRGLDLRMAYKSSIENAQLETGIDGTYIFSFDDQFTNTAPVTSLRNTVFNPTSLRLRGREVVTMGPLNVGVYLNFTNAYSNNDIAPEEHVASWLTADLVASYQFPAGPAGTHGASATFSIINVADRNPPYVANPNEFPINYDGANANALGRYFSMQLQKRW